MIKSTKVSLKFANTGRVKDIHLFIDEYRNVIAQFIDLLWELDKVTLLLPKTITSKVDTWLSARAVQCAGKQASGIVRGTRKKQSQRNYVYQKLLSENKYKQATKLKRIIDKQKTSKPIIDNMEPELDSRFTKQDWNSTTSFDGFLTLASLGNKLKITIPIKKTKHFNKLLYKGTPKEGIRLSKNKITFMFDLPDTPPKSQGSTIGLDIGILNTFSLSTGLTSTPCSHGHTLNSITKKLSKKKKGSQAFIKAQLHRTNYINWSLNQIDLSKVQTLRIENIKHMRRGRKTSRYLSHFTYTELHNKLKDLTTTHGVRLVKVNPVYTSQRCSKCGWVRSKNRKGKSFSCTVCKFTLDADTNAALNISTPLRKITTRERLLHKNRKGFYLNVAKAKPIVSPTHEPLIV